MNYDINKSMELYKELLKVAETAPNVDRVSLESFEQYFKVAGTQDSTFYKFKEECENVYGKEFESFIERACLGAVWLSLKFDKPVRLTYDTEKKKRSMERHKEKLKNEKNVFKNATEQAQTNNIRLKSHNKSFVTLSSLTADNEAWQNGGNEVAMIGLTQEGKPLELDFNEAVHVLIAGATGSGKSCMLNSIISSLMLKNTPRTANFLLIDPKRVEFFDYKNSNMLYGGAVCESIDSAVSALKDVVEEMNSRYLYLSRKSDIHDEFGLYLLNWQQSGKYCSF